MQNEFCTTPEVVLYCPNASEREHWDLPEQWCMQSAIKSCFCPHHHNHCSSPVCKCKLFGDHSNTCLLVEVYLDKCETSFHIIWSMGAMWQYSLVFYPSIHLLPLIQCGSQRQSLSREALTSLFPAISSCSSRRTPKWKHFSSVSLLWPLPDRKCSEYPRGLLVRCPYSLDWLLSLYP